MSRRIDHIVSLKYGRRAAAGPLPPSRAAERPKQGFTRRFASTARLAMSNGYRRTTGSDREPEPDLSAQKEENRRRKKALSGTQWSLGSESDMAQWKQAVQVRGRRPPAVAAHPTHSTPVSRWRRARQGTTCRPRASGRSRSK